MGTNLETIKHEMNEFIQLLGSSHCLVRIDSEYLINNKVEVNDNDTERLY